MRIVSVLRLILVLAVALAAVHSGIGRAEARGAYSMVICAEGHVRTVTMGADGRPVTHHYACPDCVMGGFAVDGVPPRLVAPVSAARRLPRLRPARCRCARAQPRPLARAPPVPARS